MRKNTQKNIFLIPKNKIFLSFPFFLFSLIIIQDPQILRSHCGWSISNFKFSSPSRKLPPERFTSLFFSRFLGKRELYVFFGQVEKLTNCCIFRLLTRIFVLIFPTIYSMAQDKKVTIFHPQFSPPVNSLAVDDIIRPILLKFCLF